MPRYIFHLIANAHIDPVWLWDWREGLNEGIATVRSVLDLMDERPEFTFIRGEAAIYQHIEKTEPETFARMKSYIEQGRWDVVGGTYIQPDTNLPATEILARQFTHAQNYFKSRFGRIPRVAWAADAFGHSAGLPEILAKAGMTGFAFTRPSAWQFKLKSPAFWWESPAGSRVLTYRPIGGYSTERDEMTNRLNGCLNDAAQYPLRNIGCFYGVGNHGGGPTRRQLDDIRRWADKHPEVTVIHSGLHRFFQALAREEKDYSEKGYPVHRGEINFCLRGCYASVAKFKFPYRRAEAELTRAEATDAIISARLNRKPGDLTKAWESVLINSFHDVLPGSSIERAYDDQLAWLGAARHEAQRIGFNALNALAAQINVSVAKPGKDRPSRIPFLVWNPHPHEYEGPVELEAALDFRPLWAYTKKVDQVPFELIGPDGKAFPFQTIRTEHSYMPDYAWRKRVVFRAKLAPMGWSIFQLGLAEKMVSIPVSSPTSGRKPNSIQNDLYRITARKGASSLQIFHRKKPMFQGAGLSVLRVEDPWGSWGGMGEEPESLHLTKIQERWKITQIELLETGPERSVLWVRFAGARSRLDLTFSLARKRPAVDVQARVFWNERCSRLKLAFPVGDQARFEVPGGVVTRGILGEVPGGRWAQVGNRFGFASDALYCFDSVRGVFRATVVRASRYGNDVKTAANEELWRPAVDAGELNFRFLLTAETPHLPKLAKELEQPVITEMVSPHRASLPPTGSLFSLEPKNIQLLALKPSTNGRGWIARLQEVSGKTTQARGRWLGKKIHFGEIRPWSLNTFRLLPKRGGWSALPTNIVESR